MKAVVMAGGQGTRLRPLTSNQPKPMVPVVSKPIVLHILELLSSFGITDIVMTVAFLPQLITNHFGDGSAFGMNIEYSVEDKPLGTAGSVKNAQASLDDTFLVISGDALTDFDLNEIIEFHREREAMVTIALKSVENPLEFGVVIVDEEGRIERFLEKPGWGQVFSDTINTGIYVIEPEALDYIPEGIPFDFSHQLFPELFEMRKPLYGVICDGYWQDVGNLEQYMQANRDALDGKIKLQIPGVRLRGNVWVGHGVSLDSFSNVEGPAVIGNYAKIDPSANIGPHTVLGNNAVLRGEAAVVNSVVWENCYFGVGTRVRGAVIGNSVDIRTSAVVAEGAVIGDQCSVGENAFVGNNVKIYPFKTIEPGSAIRSSLISESRGMSTLFGKSGVRGLINVDITPETAMRLAMSYGTLLSKDSFVTTSRDGHPASRVLKRAIIAGLNSTGVSVRDLRTAPVAVNRFDLRAGNAAGGIHVRVTPDNPEEVEILFAEPPGASIDAKRERNIENYFHREDYRRAYQDELGGVVYPPRAVEAYLAGLLDNWDVERIRRRGLRVVLDYSNSAAPMLLGSIMDRLDVELMTINVNPLSRSQAFSVERDLPQAVEKVRRLVEAMEAHVGIIIDPGVEHLFAVDEYGERVPDDSLMLLLMRHMCREEGPGEIVMPLHATRHAEVVAARNGGTVRRAKSSYSSIMAEATRTNTLFATTLGGGYIFPSFLSSMDALLTFGKVLEMIATSRTPMSSLVKEVPSVHMAREVVSCPWYLKGAVMRLMVEELKNENVSLMDGIKVLAGPNDWVHILPDADMPLCLLYAESSSEEEAKALLASYRGRLVNIIEERQAAEA